MATLNSTLTLSSTDATSDALSMTVTDSLTITSPSQGLSSTVAPVSGGTMAPVVPSGAANQYTFIKHTGKQGDGTTDSVDALSVFFVSVDVIRLAAGEWCLFPSKSDVVVSVKSTHASRTIQVEHSYWTKG